MFGSPESDNDVVQMVARAPTTGDRARPIILDGDDEEEDDVEEKKMATPPAARRDSRVTATRQSNPAPDVIEKITYES